MELEAPAPGPAPALHHDRTAWAAHMRLQFSPAAMLDSEGSILQEFFKPKCVLLVHEKRWGSTETDLLYTGLERYGVGKWRDISLQLLPSWEDQAIRLRAAKLLGSQSLARYVGWRGCREEVQQEYALNKSIGECTGCWKNGMLVENDAGSVKAYFEQRERDNQPAC